MKTIFNGILFLFLIIYTNINAQEFKETTQALSPKSKQGFFYNVSKDVLGNTSIIFKMKLDKKSEALTFEKYRFDKDLKLIDVTDDQAEKEQNKDFEQTSFYAYVGGRSSFDVLSMKLKINKLVALKKWNHEKQVYITDKIISDETIKLRNDNGKMFYGYASYASTDETKSNLLALVKTDSKDKNNFFEILTINEKLELKETKLDLSDSYSLVYCKQMPSDDVVMVFAPNKKEADISKYIYFQYDIEGNLKNKVSFKSPASALLITAAYEKEGSIYFFGSSTKSKEAFNEVFNEYAPIYNPGANGSNKLDLKWKKSLNEDMDNFHMLKFSGNQLDFASTTAISEFKTKFIMASGDKKATSYKGKRFFVESFTTTTTGDYLLAGQLMSTVKLGLENTSDSFEDIVCFHFDNTGNLKAQYGIGKMNDDKKSEIFEMKQNFYPSSDGKSIYWELMEVKGFKGYESFLDAYVGNTIFYPRYFPRILKINLDTKTLGSIKVLGNEKFFLKRNFEGVFDKVENSITYIGTDEDSKQLWISKITLK